MSNSERLGSTEGNEGNEANEGTGASFAAQELGASLTVTDLPTSRAWYRDVIGFGVDREHERNGTVFAVSLRAGVVRILLTQDNGAKGADRVKGEGFSLQFTTDQDLDAIARRVSDHSGQQVEASDTPWGARVLRLQDPDGFKLVFSSGNRP